MVSTAAPQRLRDAAAAPWLTVGSRAETVAVSALVLIVGSLSAAAGLLPLELAAAVAATPPLLFLALAKPRFALILLVFSIPFSPKVAVGKFDVTATDILVAIILGSWLARSVVQRRLELRAGPCIVAAGLLLTSALLSAGTAQDFPSAVKEIIKLAELVGIALYAASTMSATSDRRFAVMALLVAGASEAMVGLYQFATGTGPEGFAIGPFMRAYGNFGQPNALAGYLGLLLPLGIVFSFQREPGRLLAIACTLIIAAGIIASLSRGAWLGISVGLAVMAIVWSAGTRRALVAAVAGLLVLLTIGAMGFIPASITERVTVIFENFWVFDVRRVEANTSNFALVERMAHWQAGWDMALDHPLIGVGPGNYEEMYPDYYLAKWVKALGHAHNLYINTFAELGIIGLIIFVGFTTSIFVRIGQGLQTEGTMVTGDRLQGTGGRGTTLTLALSQRERELDGRGKRGLGGAQGRRELASRTGRTLLIGALGATVTFTLHNTFDNMFVHGIGVQFGLILGLIEGAVREARAR